MRIRGTARKRARPSKSAAGHPCFLHLNLLSYPAEKILLPHPLIIGAITNELMEARIVKAGQREVVKVNAWPLG